MKLTTTENFKETGKNKKSKLNHQQEYRVPLTNSFEILPIEECQDKQVPTDEDNSMLPSFYHAFSKRRQKKQSRRSNHYIPPTLHKDQLDVVLLHIG